MNTVQAAWKFVRSFFKSDWELDDYPIRIKRFEPNPESHGRLGQPFTWSAQIINWWVMSGHGYSRAEALQNLEANFERRRKADPERLPRPGMSVPLAFAPDGRGRRHEMLARDFFDRIVGVSYDECFVSDQSSLWDFHEDESNDVLCKRVLEVYGIDISDLESAVLADILDRIAARSQTLPNTPLQPTSDADTA